MSLRWTLPMALLFTACQSLESKIKSEIENMPTRSNIIKGTGTKEDPYWISTTYNGVGLTPLQRNAFENALQVYNNNGKPRRVRIDSNDVYVQFNLKCEPGSKINETVSRLHP